MAAECNDQSILAIEGNAKVRKFAVRVLELEDYFVECEQLKTVSGPCTAAARKE